MEIKFKTCPYMNARRNKEIQEPPNVRIGKQGIGTITWEDWNGIYRRFFKK